MDFLIQLNLISLFFSEAHLLVNLLLLLDLTGILFLITMYFSSRVGERDIFFKKVQQFHKVIGYLILPLFLSIFLSYIIINGNRNLKDLEFAIEINQFLYLLLLDFFLFSFLISFPIYLIKNEKIYQYYMFRFVNSVKNHYEITEISIPFYFRYFILNLSQLLKNSTDLIIANIDEIEKKFYQAFFSAKMEVLKQFAADLEKIILNQDNSNLFEFKFTTLKMIIQSINNFFKDFNIPELSFKKYSLADFLLEKYKKVSAIIMVIIVVITTISSILNLIM